MTTDKVDCMKRRIYIPAIAALLGLAALSMGYMVFSEPTSLHSGSTEYRTMEEAGNHSILVIVPHPDDEAFGFSGTLGSAVSAGAHVRVYLLNDGEGADTAKDWIRENTASPELATQADLNNDGIVDELDFAAARRDEFKASMSVLGIPEEDLVFLGNAYGGAPLPSPFKVEALADFIRNDALQAGFPLDGQTRIFTVAPQLEESDQASFYGEDYQKTIPVLHQKAAQVATLLSEGSQNAVTPSDQDDEGQDEAPLPEIVPAHIYFFKVYAHRNTYHEPTAPIVFTSSEKGFTLRRESIQQYTLLGRQSAPRIYAGAESHSHEYASTLQHFIDAGIAFP